MKNTLKRLISVFICLVLLVSISAPAFAKNINGYSNSKGFKDVKQEHWAYEDIMWMLDKKIIDGTGKDTFDPNGIVTRGQFAKMMVNTLELKQYKPETPSFLDVNKKAWEYPFVESAKIYLTGFKTTSGDYFKPSQAAVREDMAVALVKALGYQNEIADENVLNSFADAAEISPNLRKYVALSVKHGLIQGYTKDGKTVFDPQGNLTRAQSATLLHKAFEKNEEKITYDEDKVTYDDNNNSNTYVMPVVTATEENGKLVLRWNKIESSEFVGYRVVASKNDSSPTYPENGYLYSITDRSKNYAVIDNATAYTNGDFSGYFVKGEEYYFSITAEYKGRVVHGNPIKYKYNGEDSAVLYPAPQVSAVYENGKLVVKWNKVSSSLLTEYRVVISEKNQAPAYPANGYYEAAYDVNTTSVVIDISKPYINGDFTKLTYGTEYYISVTANYNGKCVAGNAVRMLYLIN